MLEIDPSLTIDVVIIFYKSRGQPSPCELAFVGVELDVNSNLKWY